jgi:RNA polymerase sigma-70 factor (ECF subfamily)
VVELGQQSVVELGIDLDAASPTGMVAAREEHRLLLKAMRRLPLEMQVALELHYWEGMTVNEISEVVDAATGTIKRRLQRARQRLDELIAELAETEDLRRSTTDNFADWALELRGFLNKSQS